MVVFYVDVEGPDDTTMFMHVDDEFFFTLANYLKLDYKNQNGSPWGFISGADLAVKVNSLPHEWLLAKPEVKQIVNGKEIIVQTKFTEEYMRKLRFDLIRLSRLAIENNVLIRWE